MPRTPDPQRSETPSPASTSSLSPARRRLALGIVALALAPVGILAGCGNAVVKQRDDTRPEPNASTEGIRSVYPTPGLPTPRGTYVAPRSGPPSPGVAVESSP